VNDLIKVSAIECEFCTVPYSKEATACWHKNGCWLFYCFVVMILSCADLVVGGHGVTVLLCANKSSV